MFLLAMGLPMLTHKIRNMENLWSLAINNAKMFTMSTTYAMHSIMVVVHDIVVVGHGHMVFWSHGLWHPPNRVIFIMKVTKGH